MVLKILIIICGRLLQRLSGIHLDINTFTFKVGDLHEPGSVPHPKCLGADVFRISDFQSPQPTRRLERMSQNCPLDLTSTPRRVCHTLPPHNNKKIKSVWSQGVWNAGYADSAAHTDQPCSLFPCVRAPMRPLPVCVLLCAFKCELLV